MGFLATTAQSSKLLSKIACNDGHGENSAYFDGWKAYESDPFHPIHNPSGVIQMGLAENQLCVDLIEEWIRKNPSSSICTSEGVNSFRDMAVFQDYHGLPDFRKGVARLMERVRRGKAKFDPNRIIMSGGATGAHELIAFCLADPGDAFLVPTPYYPGFDRDLKWRTGVQLLPIVCESSNQFKLTQTALEEAYNNAQKANVKVKGVLITNPSNPLGTILDKETLINLLSFTNAKNIHLVCDEIYSATVFKEPQFISISELIEEEANHLKYNTDLIHIVYSLSKDLGLPGFRIGIIYSYNNNVVNCGRKMSSFGLVSAQTQYLIASMLMDDDFVGNFLEESALRLRRRHDKFIEGLGNEGITCLESNAGLFCWMDLRPLLEEKTMEGEMKLWKTIIHDVKLNVSPGCSFHCSEPGWFRVCFASMEEETLELALHRIRSFMRKSSADSIMRKSKKKGGRIKDQLSVSFPLSLRGGFEEFMSMSPHSMSPHSPLVHATSSA